VPSVFEPSSFKCFTSLALAWVILGYIVSLISSLFSLYKLCIVVRERAQRLKAASIRPTLKRIVFVERTLANHSMHTLLSLVDKTGDRSDESRTSSDDLVAQMVRSVQMQLQILQQQQSQQLQQQQQGLYDELKQQLKEQLKQQQQQSQQLQQHLQDQLHVQQKQIHQLMQQLQHLQQSQL
jgi:exonuclease VII large subunit